MTLRCCNDIKIRCNMLDGFFCQRRKIIESPFIPHRPGELKYGGSSWLRFRDVIVPVPGDFCIIFRRLRSPIRQLIL